MTAETKTYPTPWRTGTKVGRTLYDAADQLIGVMDTRELAARVAAAVNAHERGTPADATANPAHELPGGFGPHTRELETLKGCLTTLLTALRVRFDPTDQTDFGTVLSMIRKRLEDT